MMEDRLSGRLQAPSGGGGGGGGMPHPPTRIHTPTLTSVTDQWAELQPRDGVQDPSTTPRADWPCEGTG
jgi:hypothetical protein